MTRKFYLFPATLFITLAGSVLVWRCTKPTQDFIINISSNIIKYKATLQFTDASDDVTVPKGLTVSLGGEDTASIYDYSGSKRLILSSSGHLTVGLDPSVDPSAEEVSFYVTASAPGYVTATIPVKINAMLNSQNFPVPMLKISTPPEGVKIVQPTVPISGGATSTPVNVGTTTDANTQVAATIAIPTGTELRDEDNRPVSGGNVVVTLAAFDPASPTAMASLPGGQIQTAVEGGPSAEVYLLPAGFTSIHMKAGQTDIRNFSKEVNVQIELNNDMMNPETNATVKAGDNLNVYSFREQTGQWYFEKSIKVTASGNKLMASFGTNHLTTFAACMPPGNVKPCTSNPSITFNAPGIDAGSSDPYIVDVYSTVLEGQGPVYSEFMTIHNGDVLNLTAVPTGDLEIKVSRVDYDHYLLRDYNNRGPLVGSARVNLCNTSSLTVEVAGPAATYLKGTGYAVCPNDNSRRYLPPNGAQVYYRKSGSGDAVRLLGFIVNGAVTTTLLTPGERYDIQGNYGGQLVGGSRILIRPGVSFLDSIYTIQTVGGSLCP